MKKKRLLIIAGIIAVILCAGGTYLFLNGGNEKNQAANAQDMTIAVKKGNLRSTISGTAQLEAEQMQMIVPPKEGMIKTLNLTRNQQVKQGDLLLELSDSNLEDRYNQAKLTLSQQEIDLQDLQSQAAALRTTAPISGKLILSTNVSEGSSVSKTTKIATIADVGQLTVTLPFLYEEAAGLRNGDTIQLAIDGFMLTKAGVVESVAKDFRSNATGKRLLDVTIRVNNDGTMDAGLTVRGSANVGGQRIESKASAVLQYKTSVTVLANTSGTIQQMAIKSDRMVNAGELIATIHNDTLQKDIRLQQAEIDQQVRSIQDLESQLEKLKIYAPFDGVFSTDFADPKKNVLSSYSVGTTIKSDDKLGAVASLDTLQLPMQVDELDLPKIKTGMKAEVKVDAVSGKTFPAEVTQVSTVGTVTNGVTFYSVVLSIKNATELKYGMTATADIIVEDKKDILLVPIEALQQRGGKRFVSLKRADGTIEANHEVKAGVNNSTMVEITEGLQEGDQVVVRPNRTQQKLSEQEINTMRQQFQQGNRQSGTTGGGIPGGGTTGGGAAGGNNNRSTTGGGNR